jgi:hypothetical protein
MSTSSSLGHRPASTKSYERTERSASTTRATTLRVTGALALLAMGVIHLEQYLGAGYSEIRTIGTLFLLNFIGAALVALGLILPLDRMANGLHTLLALAGAAMAATSIVFLLISESATIFGFRESGYSAAIVLALLAEGVAVLALFGFLATRSVRR